jgi:hypothetical protein
MLGDSKPTLLPFLAVLLCTMGALIMLLVLIARDIREPDISQGQLLRLASSELPPNQLHQPSSESLSESAESEKLIPLSEVEEALESVKYSIAEAEWMAKQFSDSKTELEKQLADGEAYLASVEKHTMKLREEVKRLIDQVKFFDKDVDKQNDVDVNTLEQLLKQKIAELEVAEKRLSELQKERKDNAKSFAIVPYRGTRGTFRMPVYVECKSDKVIIQPEGIELTAQDFLAIDRADNPFDSLLRVARQYYSETGQIERGMEPYPLIIIRPSGIHAFEAAYAAMGNWLKDYGYELVAEDWKMEYPKRNDELRERMEKQLTISRQRLQGYVAAMRLRDGANNLRITKNIDSYKPIEPNHSGEAGRQNGLRGQNGQNGQDGLSGRGGGQNNTNNTNNTVNSSQGWRGEDNGKREYTVSNGIAREVIKSGQFAEYFGADSGNRFGAVNTLGNNNNFRDNNNVGDNVGNVGNNVGNVSGNDSGLSYPSAESGVPNNVVADNRDLVNSSRNQQGSEVSGVNYENPNYKNPLRDPIKKLPSTTDAQESQNAKTSDASLNSISNTSSDLSSSLSSGSSPSLPSNLSPSLGSGLARESIGSSEQVPRVGQPVSDSVVVPESGVRGGRTFRSPVQRGVRIHVGSDRFVIIPQTGFEVSRTIMSRNSTQQSVVELVKAVSDFVETWGIAGERFYWQPVLKVKVLNGGEHQFNELQRLLKESKINILIEQE